MCVQVAYKLEQEIALWDPNTVTEATGDPFKTLFIARVNFYTRYIANIELLSGGERSGDTEQRFTIKDFEQQRIITF